MKHIKTSPAAVANEAVAVVKRSIPVPIASLQP